MDWVRPDLGTAINEITPELFGQQRIHLCHQISPNKKKFLTAMNKAHGSNQHPRGIPCNQVNTTCTALELVILLIKDEDVELNLRYHGLITIYKNWIGRSYLCSFTNSKGSFHLIKAEYTGLPNFTSMQGFSWGLLNCSTHPLLWIQINQYVAVVVINNEEKPVILKKLKMPGTGQITLSNKWTWPTRWCNLHVNKTGMNVLVEHKEMG